MILPFQSDPHSLESSLAVSEAALHAVVNEIGHPVVLMSKNGKVLQENDAAQRVLGRVLQGTADGACFCPFLHEPDGTPKMPDFIGGAIQTGQRQEREISRFGRWWRIHLVPLHNWERDVRCLLLLAEDVSSFKTEQQQVLERERALTQTLVREVHHRIKNHLQGLIGYLRVNSSTWQSVREAVDAAIVHIQSVAIVHGLLAQKGETSIRFSKLLEQIVATVRINSRIPVDCSIDSADSEYMMVRQEEAVSLALAVGELLSNAVKHTPVTPDSRIQVRLGCPADAIELTITNSPSHLPANFSLERSVNTGLDLAKALLPRDRTTLAITQCADAVVTRFGLKPILPVKG